MVIPPEPSGPRFHLFGKRRAPSAKSHNADNAADPYERAGRTAKLDRELVVEVVLGGGFLRSSCLALWRSGRVAGRSGRGCGWPDHLSR